MSLERKIYKRYNAKAIRRNMFGRRQALPSEIAKHLEKVRSDTFEAQERFYQPTDKDIERKTNRLPDEKER